MNRRLKMSMFAVLLVCLCSLGEKGVSAYSRERAAWVKMFPNAQVSYFWHFWRPWFPTRGKRIQTGAIS